MNCLLINVCLKYGLMMAITKLWRLSCCGFFAMLRSGDGSVPAARLRHLELEICCVSFESQWGDCRHAPKWWQCEAGLSHLQ